MNVIKKMKLGALALSIASVFAACSSDDDTTTTPDQGTLKIAARATYEHALSKDEPNVSFSKFLVNFKEIELERQEMDADTINQSDFYGSDDDVKLKGPFEIDLLSQNNIELVNIKIPNGIYEEIEFEFDKSEKTDSELFGKSMKLIGEINGVPFVFWHNFNEEIKIDYEDLDQRLVIDNNTKEVFINFNLSAVINMVDLSSATDGDGDGVITISPEDADGNNVLAGLIKEAIKSQIDLMED